MGTPNPERIGGTLFGKTRRTVLALLYGQPGQAFYVRQIARMAGTGLGAVQRELRQLAEAGLVTRTVQGRQVYYRANQDSPVYPEIRALMLKTAGMADVLRAALAELGERVRLAVLFGSVAAGKENRSSDVDVLVVGDATFGEVTAALSNAESRLGREVNPLVYPPSEFRSKLQSGRGFLHNVLRGHKVYLIGDDDELARLAQ